MFKKISRGFLSAIYRDICIVCESEEEMVHNHLCRCCHSSIRFLRHHCQAAVSKYYDNLWSLAAFEGPWLEIIHKYKYENSTAALGVIRHLLEGNVPSFDEVDFIVPVPLDPLHYFRRNYNQSHIIAKIISGLISRPVLGRAIVKRPFKRHQVGLAFNERINNPKKTYQRSKIFADTVQDKTILLVDDVVTTGSTLNECAKILRRSGATTVSALTLAKAL